MSDPWQTLILDRSTATERDVKAAYAVLLKQHRPDADPEGFQRVRSAYLEALEWLKHNTEDRGPSAKKSASTDLPCPPLSSATTSEESSPEIGQNSNPEAAHSPPHTNNHAPEDLPAELRETLANLAEAWRKSSREGLAAAFAKFSADALKLRLPAQTICQLLHHAVGGKAEPVAQHAPADLLLHLLRGGETQVVLEVAKEWDSSHSIPSAALLAMAMDRTQYQPADEEAAMVLAHLTRIIAFHHPGLANQLANSAYPLLPRDGRDQIMGFLEYQISMGKIFFGFPAEIQRFWKSRLNQHEDRDTIDWFSTEALEALRYVVQNRGHTWEGLSVVQQLVPADIWQRAETALRAQATQAQKGKKTLRTGGKGFQGWMWVLFVLAANLARMFTHDSTSPSPALRPVPSYARAAEVQRAEHAMKEIQRTFNNEARRKARLSFPQPGPTTQPPLAPPWLLDRTVLPAPSAPQQRAVPIIPTTLPTLQSSPSLAPQPSPQLAIPNSPGTSR